MTLSHAAQSGSHSLADRGLDLYETPPCAVEALLRVETLPLTIWEPCAGRGNVVRVLRAAGHTVIAGDIVAYDGFKLDFVADFFSTVLPPAGCGAIATNPPFQHAAEFARHALDLVPRVYLLLRLAFLESVGRSDILERRGLACVHVFRDRLPMMHRSGWTGPRASNAMPFAWFAWSRDHHGPTLIDRISAKTSPTLFDEAT